MKIHHEKVIQKDKELVDALDFEGIEFIVSKNDFENEKQNLDQCFLL